VHPEFTIVGNDRIIGSTIWLDEDGKQIERFQVLTVRDGKIVDVQGCETRRQAERFAHRRRDLSRPLDQVTGRRRPPRVGQG
jgi:hypothetical protein